MEKNKKSLKSLRKFFRIISFVEMCLIWGIVMESSRYIIYEVLGIGEKNVSADNEILAVYIGAFAVLIMFGAMFLGFKTCDWLEDKYC